ncbi:unnamed protein product [Rhizoctonia solani]|uniref:glucokinase n=1 Tax=Rhizoctonia solani TaxID=456999 RepID=A0A8H2WZS5_9AGAM|nr:unnamed protein product [Rhizoctonia solani]
MPDTMGQAKKPEIKTTPWTYFFVRLLFKFVLKVFYGTIVVENEHFIPGDGEACIVCANHSNSLTDALVLVASISSKKRNFLRLTAKDSQFGKPTFQSWLIESAGTLPIKRRKDHAEGEADNTVVMGALVKALEEGDAVCLFPEGMSRYHPSVAPMRTGVARIASDVLTQQKDNPDFRLNLLTCSITYMHREHFRSDVLVSFNPPLQLDPKAPPSWKVIRTAKAAGRIYVPLGTSMGLGDWVRVVGRFGGEAGFGGTISAQWQPDSSGEENPVEKIEQSSISDEFVETLAQDIQLYQTHLERLGLKDFRVLQYSTLSRRRIATRILIRIPLIVLLGLLALPGLVLWLPVFATVSYFTKKHKQTGPVWDTYDEISQTKLIYGLAAGVITWLVACIVTLPFAPATALIVPGIMWMTLRWTEDLIAGVRSVVALTRLLLVGKPEMSKTLLWREDIHARIMKLATERLELPANPEKFFSTKNSPGPRWDTKGGADKGRTQGLWARGFDAFRFRSTSIMPPPPSWSSQVSTAVPEATRKLMANIEQSFFLSEEKLKAIEEKFVQDFRLGYSKYGQAMAMIPTFVTGVPNGSETGTFLAVDLGGTNLRVCEVVLNGDSTFQLRAQKFKVSTELKTGTATALFDYIASCVDAFLNESKHASTFDDVLSLGLTFSFPVEQTALDRGKVLTWTKGFSATGAIGHDVVVLLQDALDRKNLHVKCTALVNDTVGTLLSHAYATGGCLLGAIFGTGTNGAFVEKTASFTKMGSALSEVKSEYMVVNTEWGAFDNERTVLDVTPFDNKLDRESINPRFQCFEKLISGMYLGEITRNILLYLIDNNMLFSGRSTAELNKHYGFDTALMSAIESDTTADLSQTRQTLVKELNLEEKLIKKADLEIVRWACHLFEFYPNFEQRLRLSLELLVGPEIEKEVKIGRAKDGSGVGAALCALQASKQTKP